MIKESDERTAPGLKEAHNPDWLLSADDSDLVLLRSELEEFDIHAERIYNAVKASPDRYVQREVNSLISQLKTINKTLGNLATAWEADTMATD